MISGIISKTSGSISVNGEEDIDRYRHSIGYCPQHNAFMHYFTVKDHLMFFAAVSIIGLTRMVFIRFAAEQCTARSFSRFREFRPTKNVQSFLKPPKGKQLDKVMSYDSPELKARVTFCII